MTTPEDVMEQHTGETEKPAGVVGVVIAPEGFVVGNASDFHPDRPAGFSLYEAQRHRVRDALAVDVVERGCSHYLVKAMRGYGAATLLDRMQADRGFRIEYIAVGQEGG